jgi:hypothetical protein
MHPGSRDEFGSEEAVHGILIDRRHTCSLSIIRIRAHGPSNDLNPSHRSIHNRRPKEPTLRLLNNLLIYRLRRVIHDNRALLVVDLGVDACISDEVYDPLLAFGLGEVEAAG